MSIPSRTSGNAEDCAVMYRYEVLKDSHSFRGKWAYGLLCRADTGSGFTVVAVTAPFSANEAAVAELAAKCTKLQISPDLSLMEAICEFMSDEEKAEQR